MSIKSSGKIDGYYERQKIAMVADPASTILVKAHHDLEGIDLEGIDLVRFTFELDEAVSEICEVVPIIVGAQARNSVSNLGARSPSGVRMTRVRIWWRR